MEQFLPLLLLLPLALLVLRQRKQQRGFAEQQRRVAVGTHVVTTSGLYGTVVAVEDEVVVLQVAAGVRVRWARAAVGRILDTPPGDVPAAPTSLTKPTSAPDGD